MTNTYNEAPATYHDKGKLVDVVIHDRMPGKVGFTNVILPDGNHEFVEDWRLTYGQHTADCETCEDEEI